MENTLYAELPLGEVNTEGDTQRLCFDHGYYVGSLNWDVCPGCESDLLGDDCEIFGENYTEAIYDDDLGVVSWLEVG